MPKPGILDSVPMHAPRETSDAPVKEGKKAEKQPVFKTVFTTGEAAKICRVSQQTIILCFDNGQLKGFRVPGSRMRKIPRKFLHQFMRENGIPTDAFVRDEKETALFVQDDVRAALQELHSKSNLRFLGSSFELGLSARDLPQKVVVQESCDPAFAHILQTLRKTREDARITAILDGNGNEEDLPGLGLEQMIRSENPAEIAAALEQFVKPEEEERW